MMPNRSGDTLFQLIKSLQKGEKRNFKLYITRNSSNEDLKIIQLFDVLDRMNEYDENYLLQRIQSIRKDQLANRKAHLYKQILASLRLLETDQNIDLHLHEQLDHARILYNKGLYHQSLKILDKAKEQAKARNQYSFLVQIVFLEKKIESLHITRSIQDRARQLATESNEVVEHIAMITALSNLALELYGWYINHGHARNEQDETELHAFFKKHMPPGTVSTSDFYQRLYYNQSHCWYAFIVLDFLMYYRYVQKWVDLFREQPKMIEIETAHYIKALHNLASAHFDLKNIERFEATISEFEQFATMPVVTESENNSVQVFVYLYTAKINRHFLYGTFAEGLALVPEIMEKLQHYTIYLDRHRVLVFYYKIASLYFGNDDYDNTIEYLNKIINLRTDLRNDLQCYARLLNLIAHYELGNFDLLEYLVKSVYRFMAKMESLGPVELEIFRFLKHAFDLTPADLAPEFESLLSKLKSYENDRLASRAFAYLDIISWLESKIEGKRIGEIIRRKSLANKRMTTSRSDS